MDSSNPLIEEIVSRARNEGRHSLLEPEGKLLLQSCGVTVPAGQVVDSQEDMAPLVNKLRSPMVMKIVSRDVIHKSDVGGVALNLSTAQGLRDARQSMTDALASNGLAADQFLVEEMAPRGIEMVVGGFVDRDFGPMVMLGFGGVFVEVNKDVVFAICPVDKHDVTEMIGQLRGKPLLEGARGSKPVDLSALVATVMTIGGPDGILMRHGHDIAEIDINPLIVTSEGVNAVDARFILSEETDHRG